MAGLLYCGPAIVAQNLVVNPSFEEVTECPKFWSVVPENFTVAGWTSPTQATPDNFSSCSELSGVPNNWAGVMDAHTGEAYVGIIARRNFGLKTDDPKRSTHREYLQTVLKEPLKEGQRYRVSFYVVLAENCRMASDLIQVSFGDKSITSSTRERLALPAHVSTTTGRVYESATEWQLIEGEYTAKGGESVMTIGNFATNRGASFEHVFHKIRNEGKPFEFSYYFIDDVTVEMIPEPPVASDANPADDEVAVTSPEGTTDATGTDLDPLTVAVETELPSGNSVTEQPEGTTSLPDNSQTELGSATGSDQTPAGRAETPAAGSASTNPSTQVSAQDPDQGAIHDHGQVNEDQAFYYLTEEELKKKNLGPIVRDFKCECAFCHSDRHENLYSEVIVDKVDSTTYRKGQVVNLSDVWFELRTDKLLPESKESLDKLAFLLSELPDTEVELVIHMNYFGDDDENQELSKGTAATLYNYLRDKGVNNKILYNGYGKALTPPLNGRQRDRTIALVIRKT